MKLAILLLCIYLNIQLSREKCSKSKELTWEVKLKKYLNACSSLLPPTKNKTEPIDVNLHFKLRRFHYMSWEEEFYIYTWTSFSWNDERLRWDPSKFNGIKSTIRHGAKIWKPSIEVLNSFDDSYTFRQAPCTIYNEGRISCMEPMLLMSKCSADLSEWPRDAQTCSVEFSGRKGRFGATIRLNLGYKALSMFNSEYGMEWDIMDYKQEVNQSSMVHLNMTFTLERHAKILVALVIYPAVVLSALTLSTLVLDARRDLRVFLACFSLMCHFYFLSDLTKEIPHYSNFPPKILFYFRSSLILTTINVVLTMILKTLCRRDKPVPAWITLVNEKVFKSNTRFLVFPRWLTDVSDDDKSEHVKEWTDFSSLINSVWIYVSVVDYIVFYYVFVPPKRPWY